MNYKIIIVICLLYFIGSLPFFINEKESPKEQINDTFITKQIIIQKKENITHSYNCTITAYNPDEYQTDKTPYETALMETPVQGWTCAVSEDLKKYLGCKVYIYGQGVFRVNDLMNKRFKKRIDIFKEKRKDAINFGKKEKFVVFF